MMSLLLVAKRKSCSSIILSSCYSASAAIQNLSSSSSSSAAAAAAPDPKPLHFIAADHLITTWGFSPNKAATISNRLVHLKSPDKADAVLRFLAHHGFSDTQIKTLISWHPPLLYSSPDNTLGPNLRALRDIGLSPSALTQIILSSPSSLHLTSAVPRINFWWDFLGRNEATLVKAFKKNTGIITRDITRNIAPKLSLLQDHGLSTHDVQRIVVTIPRFITSNIASMENLLNRAKEFGFQPESGGMFVLGLQAVTCATKETLQKKKELLESFGWSEGQFLSALLKAPGIVTLSEKNLRAKMDFLVGEVRCDTAHIVSNPTLLAFSLEKRLRPRHHVLHFLESKGLFSKKPAFFTAIILSDIKFVEKYILPHEKEISGLREAYLAAFVSRTTSPLQKFK